MYRRRAVKLSEEPALKAPGKSRLKQIRPRESITGLPELNCSSCSAQASGDGLEAQYQSLGSEKRMVCFFLFLLPIRTGGWERKCGRGRGFAKTLWMQPHRAALSSPSSCPRCFKCSLPHRAGLGNVLQSLYETRLSTQILFEQWKEVKVENILVAKSQLSKLDFTLNTTSLKLIRPLLKRVSISFKTAHI